MLKGFSTAQRHMAGAHTPNNSAQSDGRSSKKPRTERPVVEETKGWVHFRN